MSVIGTNQSKTVVSPTGQRKAGIGYWGDTVYTWGDAIMTWGGITLVPTNQSKPSDTLLVTDEGYYLVTDEGFYITTYIIGTPTNQSKS